MCYLSQIIAFDCVRQRGAGEAGAVMRSAPLAQ
jgi:hypothetical protein